MTDARVHQLHIAFGHGHDGDKMHYSGFFKHPFPCWTLLLFITLIIEGGMKDCGYSHKETSRLCYSGVEKLHLYLLRSNTFLFMHTHAIPDGKGIA